MGFLEQVIHLQYYITIGHVFIPLVFHYNSILYFKLCGRKSWVLLSQMKI